MPVPRPSMEERSHRITAAASVSGAATRAAQAAAIASPEEISDQRSVAGSLVLLPVNKLTISSTSSPMSWLKEDEGV